MNTPIIVLCAGGHSKVLINILLARNEEVIGIVDQNPAKHGTRLLGIPDAEEVIFTKNATESINLVLKGWLRPGDRVIFSGMEHNAVVRPVEP